MEEAARLVQQEETQRQNTYTENGKCSSVSIEQLVSDVGAIQLSTSSHAAAAKTVSQRDGPTSLQNPSHTQSKEEEETGLATIRLPSGPYSSVPSDTNKPLIEELENPHSQLQLQHQVENGDSNNDSTSGSSSELESSSSSDSLEEDCASTDSSETKQNSK